MPLSARLPEETKDAETVRLAPLVELPLGLLVPLLGLPPPQALNKNKHAEKVISQFVFFSVI
ncbi:MAG TPA: hypothetical protein EYG71_03870 [Leucothrix sp.]|nr:hypothetical protein [Leucothrix sp.]